ncbi:MAG: hypothetical protein ACLT1J_03655 [Mediterraneibacter gnavus]
MDGGKEHLRRILILRDISMMLGGPTANFRHPSCEKQLTKGACPEQAVSVPDTM